MNEDADLYLTAPAPAIHWPDEEIRDFPRPSMLLAGMLAGAASWAVLLGLGYALVRTLIR